MSLANILEAKVYKNLLFVMVGNIINYIFFIKSFDNLKQSYKYLKVDFTT